MALESAIGVARLFGMEGDDVTRQINVHTQLGPYKKNVLASQLKLTLFLPSSVELRGAELSFMLSLCAFWPFRVQTCHRLSLSKHLGPPHMPEGGEIGVIFEETLTANKHVYVTVIPPKLGLQVLDACSTSSVPQWNLDTVSSLSKIHFYYR